jgi:hypothetical protein
MQNSDDDPLTRAENAEFDRLQSCFTEAQYDAVERALCLRAYVIGWLGDPFKQPARVILNIAREIAAAA